MTVRVVYDTNVVVSAALKAGSLPATVLALALGGHVQLCLSPPILTEYHEVLYRPKFGLATATVDALLHDLQHSALIVTPSMSFTIAPDDADNRFLECARAVEAAYLVTGNTRHFPASEFQGTRIVNPAEFVACIAETLA